LEKYKILLEMVEIYRFQAKREFVMPANACIQVFVTEEPLMDSRLRHAGMTAKASDVVN